MKSAETQTADLDEGDDTLPLQAVLDCIHRVHGINLSYDEVLEEARAERDRVIPDSFSTVAQGTQALKSDAEEDIEKSSEY
jgi:hypothetical protein